MRGKMLALASMAMALSANQGMSYVPEPKEPTPDWKRKTCKSCHFIHTQRGCYKPKRKACKNYLPK